MGFVFHIIYALIHAYFRLIGPNHKRRLLAEIIVLKAQLIIARRKYPRSPSLGPIQRFTLGVAFLFIPVNRLSRYAIIVKPATIVKFHRWLVQKKYSLFFRNTSRKPGRPPMSKDIRKLILDIKNHNPCFGCPQIAALIEDRIGLPISEETIRRVLMRYYKGTPGNGPSWLSFLASQADSLWSLDLFRVESILVKSFWVMVVMDNWSRKIIGFAVTPGTVTGESLCEMFNKILSSSKIPKRLAHDHDPLFRFIRWTQNMDILDIEQIWTVPFVPISNPFVERLIGTVRTDLLDRILFWNGPDLERKLENYRTYHNQIRVHSGINGQIPENRYQSKLPTHTSPHQLKWKTYCHGLFNVPIAA